MILELKNTSRKFTSGERSIEVLSNVNFDISSGETVAIVGPSGSGKTTLLGLCAGLDIPTSGNIQLVGGNLEKMSEDQRAILRRDKVGFVFQNFELIPTLTALENVAIPLDLKNVSGANQKAQEFLNRVGLEHRAHHYPTQLSGGEQQRVAIARAFVHNPQIVFADEPTGNLDEETGTNIENLLFSLNKERGTTLVLVTHNLDLAAKAQRIIELKSGVVIRDEKSKSEGLEN
ncbi:MAG: ABC transporter ATP-binding protein [Salibacteraceae bacterium]